MIRESRFLISHYPYAVNLSSLTVTEAGEHWDGTPTYTAVLDAAWFRRTHGVTTSHVGYLWHVQTSPSTDVAGFLAQHSDSRGFVQRGRWDGERYRGSVDPVEMEQHLELLRPMLANYPAIPDGYSGWYFFERKGV